MPTWEEFGMQEAQGAIGSVLGLALGGINNARQIKQQRKLNELANEQTDYNYSKQLQMWKDTSYGAQKEQLIKAGLNPGLMYGMGGGGGQTVGSGAGASSSQAPAGGGEAQQMGIQAMGMQMEMIKAQIEKTKAETQKVTAETGNVPLTGEQIKASTANTQLDTQIKEIEKQFQENTRGNREDLIAQELNIRKEQLQIIENDATISEETKDDMIKQKKAEAVQAVLQKAKIIAETKLSGAQKDVAIKQLAVMDQQIKTLINNRYLGWAELQEKGFNRSQEGGDDNAVFNIPIIGGLIKDVEKFVTEAPRNPVGFKRKG